MEGLHQIFSPQLFHADMSVPFEALEFRARNSAATFMQQLEHLPEIASLVSANKTSHDCVFLSVVVDLISLETLLPRQLLPFTRVATKEEQVEMEKELYNKYGVRIPFMVCTHFSVLVRVVEGKDNADYFNFNLALNCWPMQILENGNTDRASATTFHLMKQPGFLSELESAPNPDTFLRHNYLLNMKQCAACHKKALKMGKCSGCRGVRYCSQECQTRGWYDDGHRSECVKK